MEEYEKICIECGRRFLVQVTTMGVPGGKDREEIICPYCNADNGYRMTDGFVYTSEIEEHD